VTINNVREKAKWLLSSSPDKIKCTNCYKLVDTPAEVASYPSGTCPNCSSPWTGLEQRHTAIVVTAPESIQGAT